MRSKLIILILVPCLIKSCGNKPRRIQYFVEGHFIGCSENNKDEIYYLDVWSITKREYKKSEKINIFCDDVKGGYYKIDLYSFNTNDGTKITYNFYNPEPSKTPYQNITYRDQYRNYFMPRFTEDDQQFYESATYYSVEYHYNNGATYNLFIYFYLEDFFYDK